MERSVAIIATTELFTRYAARLVVDIDPAIAEVNRSRAAEGQGPTTNQPEHYRRFYGRLLEHHLRDLHALPQEGSLHPAAAWSLRYYHGLSEAWLVSDSRDHEARSMWFDVLAEQSLGAISPDYDPGRNWAERLASLEQDEAFLPGG